MKLIVGLGNPGTQYQKHRHNIGFVFLDYLAKRWGFLIDREKFQSCYGEGFYKDQKVLLIKPQTYMNLSGRSVAQWLQFYKLDPKDLLVIHDELDLAFGQVKLHRASSTAGHNGIRSLKENLGHTDFYRLRLGIGRPARKSVTNFVLSDFSKEEEQFLEENWPHWAEGVELFLREDLDAAQLLLHSKRA
ncbi:MAG: aminoacyl-tRNA hydrolase [Deltaproteobacteria bacterium]|nr:aminoacyl-tRNA hydrolase [Deltaproteobacteria bacterium]